MLPEHGRRHEPERIVVSPGPDGRDDLLRLGGREDELEVRRRLLDQLQQRIEALAGHHVRLVNDVDLEAAGHRGIEGPFPQVPGVVHAAMRGGVDLDDIDAAGAGGRERDAGRALAAGVGGRALLAVQRASQDPRARGLAAAARAAEQVGMMHPPAAQRLAERLGDLVLALDLGEAGRAVPAVERQRRGGKARPRGVRWVRGLTGTGGVACHDHILARKVKDPPHTRQGPRTLAAFRPWGSWRDERRARGLAASLAKTADGADRSRPGGADRGIRRFRPELPGFGRQASPPGRGHVLPVCRLADGGFA